MRGAMMKKILVVDDEENIRFLYQEELEEEGYTVDVAAHGQEALEKLNAFQPDLVAWHGWSRNIAEDQGGPTGSAGHIMLCIW
jgi:DNA-binding NtrC family response regulator